VTEKFMVLDPAEILRKNGDFGKILLRIQAGASEEEMWDVPEEKFLNTCRRACVFFCARNDGNDGLTARKTLRCFRSCFWEYA